MSLEINNETIDDDLIHEELKYALQDWQRPPTPQERENLLQSVKEGLIYKTLLRQEAEKIQVSISPQTIEREYHNFFANQTDPKDKDQVKKYIESKLKESHLIENICQDLSPPLPVHLNTFYNDNRDHYFIAKEFQYLELGFRYPELKSHPRIHQILTDIHQQISTLSPLPNSAHQASQAIEKVLDTEGKEFLPYFFSRNWKIAIGELNKEGLQFLEHLAETKISQVTDHPGESLLFTPVESDEPQHDPYLGFFVFIQTRSDFIPTFEEIKEKVKSDLWEEMRKIKVKAHLRQLMEKSTIRDISHI